MMSKDPPIFSETLRLYFRADTEHETKTIGRTLGTFLAGKSLSVGSEGAKGSGKSTLFNAAFNQLALLEGHKPRDSYSRPVGTHDDKTRNIDVYKDSASDTRQTRMFDYWELPRFKAPPDRWGARDLYKTMAGFPFRDLEGNDLIEHCNFKTDISIIRGRGVPKPLSIVIEIDANKSGARLITIDFNRSALNANSVLKTFSDLKDLTAKAPKEVNVCPLFTKDAFLGSLISPVEHHINLE